MPKGKKNNKKGVWYIGGKKRKQQGGAILIGFIASIAGPILGEIAKPIFKKIAGGKINKKQRGGKFPALLAASLAGPFLKKLVGGKRPRSLIRYI